MPDCILNKYLGWTLKIRVKPRAHYMVVTKNANVKDVERSDETQSPQVVNVVW